MSNKAKFSNTYKKLYGNYNCKIRAVADVTIFPIYGCRSKPSMNFSQGICNYTKEGRKLIHDRLNGSYTILIEYLLITQSDNNSIEYNDNRISFMAGQRWLCDVTGVALNPSNMECHHKKPRSLGGTYEYSNLVWLCKEVPL